MRIKEKHGKWVEARDVRVGDYVMAARIDPSGALAWEPARVQASLHPEPQRELTMMQLAWGKDESIIVAPDHVFMRADGTLARAKDLKVGDHLRLANGGSVVLDEVRAGSFRDHGPVNLAIDSHHGHLLDANGLVMADITAQSAWKPHGEAPTIGTLELEPRR